MVRDEEDDLPLIEEWLLKYPGGTVDLVQDHETGIARIFLDHPRKLNALSGMSLSRQSFRSLQFLPRVPTFVAKAEQQRSRAQRF